MRFNFSDRRLVERLKLAAYVLAGVDVILLVAVIAKIGGAK